MARRMVKKSPLYDLIVIGLLATMGVSCVGCGESERPEGADYTNFSSGPANASAFAQTLALVWPRTLMISPVLPGNRRMCRHCNPCPVMGSCRNKSPIQAPACLSLRGLTHYSQQAKNLEDMGKNNGAILFYQQTVMGCRGTSESDEAVARLKKLGGRVPNESESAPLKVPDPWSPPNPRPRYASTEEYGRAIDKMLIRGMQSVIQGGNTQSYSGVRQTEGGHFCGATCQDGHPCGRWVANSVFCYQHGG